MPQESNERQRTVAQISPPSNVTMTPNRPTKEQPSPTDSPLERPQAKSMPAENAPGMTTALKTTPTQGTKGGIWQYRRQRLRNRADLVAYAMTKTGGYVFLWIYLAEMKLIRWLVEPSQSFFAACKVGMFIKDPLGRKERNESQVIRLEDVEKGTGLRVKCGPLEVIAPKIGTIREALVLRDRGADLFVPQLSWEPDPLQRFTIMDRTGTCEVVPMVDRIEQPRSTEPIVHLQLYAQYGSLELPNWSFLGRAVTSGHDAVCWAMYGHLYAKVAMPNGGAVPIELSALGTAGSTQGPFEASICPRLQGAPKLAQAWLRRFHSIFEIPLSEQVGDLRPDWSSSFPVDEAIEA